MSRIKNSLENLSASIGNLEASLQLIEETSAGVQRDMFSNGLGKNVAKKLNAAIAHVEKMLGDAQS